MARRKKTTAKLGKHELTRREELLLTIIARLMHRNMVTSQGNWFVGDGKPDKYDVYVEDAYSVGDLVITSTSIGIKPNKWNVSVVHAILDRGTCLLRDIFSGEICTYSNESFRRIVGLPFTVSLTDEEYAIWDRFCEACKAVDDYLLTPAFVKFNENMVICSTRERWTSEFCEFTFARNSPKVDMMEELRSHVAQLQERSVAGQMRSLQDTQVHVEAHT